MASRSSFKIAVFTIVVLNTTFVQESFSASTINLAPIAVSFDNKKCRTTQTHGRLPAAYLLWGPLSQNSSNPEIRNYVIALDRYLKETYGESCELFTSVGLTTDITADVLPYLKAAVQLIRLHNPGNIELFLNSKGGLVREAMNIGDYISSEEMSVSVPQNAVCLSSCVLIYAAGTTRFGYGNIGIHRPFSYEVTTDNLEYTQYLKVYDSTLLSINRYLRKFGVSSAVVDAMSSIPSDDIRILSDIELDAWGLGKDNVAKREFDKARTIQICGREFQGLVAQYTALVDACLKDSSASLNLFGACYDKANATYPGYSKQRSDCSNLMSAQ